MAVRLIAILLFLTTCLSGLWSQQPDSTIRTNIDSLAAQALPDTIPVAAKKDGPIRHFFTHKYPNPRKALLLSIIPGGGQAYNKKWWKLPIVYGALGGMLYWEIDNIREYRALRDNYLWAVDDDPNTNPTEAPYNQLDATSLKKYRDQFRRYTELTSLGLGLMYLAAAADAFVDAHLYHFDVSDDLSLRPAILPSTDGLTTIGLGFRFQFGGPPPRPIVKP